MSNKFFILSILVLGLCAVGVSSIEAYENRFSSFTFTIPQIREISIPASLPVITTDARRVINYSRNHRRYTTVATTTDPVATTTDPVATTTATTTDPVATTTDPVATTTATTTDPVATTTATTTNRFCINYGHQVSQNSSTGYYDLTTGGQTDKDFTILKSSGINCIRLAYAWHTDANNQKLAEYAKNRGFYVIFGGDAGTLRKKDLKAYNSRVLTAAAWAESKGIDQFSLGNEQEYRLSGISLGTWIANLHYLASEVKKIYHGKVSYDFSGDYLTQYISGGKGPLDQYGINAYCCWGSFADRAAAAWGENGFYFGEFNVDRKYVSFPTDADWATGLQNAYIDIKGHDTLPIYYFTFRDGGYGVPEGMWAVMKKDNTLVQPVADVLGIQGL